MKSKIRLIILLVLIFLVGGFFYSRYFYHPLAPNGQAVLSWKGSDDDTIKGYKIYYGTAKRTSDCPPGGYSENLDAGKDPSYTIRNLENGKTYFFSVTSYNDLNVESCFSEEMSKTIKPSKLAVLKAFFSGIFRK